MIKALPATIDGVTYDPKDASFQENDHMDFYNGWYYCGTHKSGRSLRDPDCYVLKRNGEVYYALVDHNDPWEYASPEQSSLHRYGKAGRVLLAATEQLF